jgi:hypothetical protein
MARRRREGACIKENTGLYKHDVGKRMTPRYSVLLGPWRCTGVHCAASVYRPLRLVADLAPCTAPCCALLRPAAPCCALLRPAAPCCALLRPAAPCSPVHETTRVCVATCTTQIRNGRKTALTATQPEYQSLGKPLLRHPCRLPASPLLSRAACHDSAANDKLVQVRRPVTAGAVARAGIRLLKCCHLLTLL